MKRGTTGAGKGLAGAHDSIQVGETGRSAAGSSREGGQIGAHDSSQAGETGSGRTIGSLASVHGSVLSVDGSTDAAGRGARVLGEKPGQGNLRQRLREQKQLAGVGAVAALFPQRVVTAGLAGSWMEAVAAAQGGQQGGK